MSSFDPSCIDVRDFLECLDIQNVSQATQSEIRFSCPFPNHANGDQNASAYMNMETTAFFCHGCKERGNAVKFTEYVLNVSPLEAVRMLRERYNPGGIDPDARNMVEEVKKILAPPEPEPENPILDESLFDQFAVNWGVAEREYILNNGFVACDYMFDRGFLPDTLAKWEFGYDARTDRVVFAVRDEKGRLVGFKGRAYDHREPKYLVLGDTPQKPGRYGWDRYFVSKIVFGAHRVPPNCPLIVCEGELNVVALDQRIDSPAVAINGSHFSQTQAKIIRNIASSVILFLDCDKAGEEATWGWEDSKGYWRPGIVDLLQPFMPVYIVPEHKGDPASMDAGEIEWLIENSESALALAIK
jgi:DNA primase